ncbi:hypothetical protein Q5M49_12180 [Acinetobacter nosocomialis]|uniref:hypothetical protein n=1 Tax=Acinetobacter nosocomialis TaxID=106654 RepID=UPI0025A950DE|nr:hypothetical protein [Acinetobacter nosocomialis]MDM9637795.1 hypothetical protein [Acinetobacter nosocomialis]MDO7194430.1 hypothetical protein [Acinetobacter nosocomialis]
MELTTALELINSKLGTTIGNIISLLVAFIVLYGFLVKTGIIEHISLVATYKQRKKDKLIATKEKLIMESRLDSQTKEHTIHHQNVLFLQKELGTDEKDLNKLKYLNGYSDRDKAVETFELCSDLTTYNNITKKIEPKDNVNIVNANRNRLIGSFIYFAISILSFFLMIYINAKFTASITTRSELLFLIILSALVLGGGVYIAFKILTYFMKLKYLEWLLKMDRIESSITAIEPSESPVEIINNLERQP